MKDKVTLTGNHLKVFDVVHVARDHYPITVDTWERIRGGRKTLEEKIAQGAKAYGVTTGVGSQKAHSLSPEEIQEFNDRLLTAHATVASRETHDPEVIRAALVVQLNAFVTGKSAIREETVRAILERLQKNEIPTVSLGGSVGASDLVPLAQMGLPLIGKRHPYESGEKGTKAKTKAKPREPLRLEAKEALSLMNSNAVSLGHGALVLLKARKLIRGFDLGACFSMEGFRGNLSILSNAVVGAHPQPGQMTATRHMRRLLAASRLWQEGEARFLQDPLSFRCAPQVQGAAYNCLEWVWQNWEVEMNTVQDNPVLDTAPGEGGGDLVNHGNMDSTLLTLGSDSLRSAMATLVDISAQRLHKLHWPAFSGLPSGLTDKDSPLGGVQFLNLSHIAEAYAARVRSAANPSLLNYQGQLADGVEDHATLLPHAVRETERLINAAWVILALELAIAVWAIRRRGLTVDDLGEGLHVVYGKIEEVLPIGREGGEVFDIQPIIEMVKTEEIVDLIDEDAPPVPEFPEKPSV